MTVSVSVVAVVMVMMSAAALLVLSEEHAVGDSETCAAGRCRD